MSLKFVSEKELQENREKFGIKPAGEDEHYDPRPLFEKLQEKSQLEEDLFYERFKSQPPKAIDEDEYDFLEEHKQLQSRIERKIQQEDEKLLKQFATEQTKTSLVEPDLSSVLSKAMQNTAENMEETPVTSIIGKRAKVPIKKNPPKKNSLPVVIAKKSQTQPAPVISENTAKLIKNSAMSLLSCYKNK